jgi:hypothetical protein
VLYFVKAEGHKMTLSHFDVFIAVLCCIACFSTDCKKAQTVGTRDLQVLLILEARKDFSTAT